MNKLHNEDCISVMRSMEDKSVDLVLTDPPYLMDYLSGRRKESFGKIENDVDSYDLISDYFDECERIMKDDTHIYSFCSWHRIDFFKQEFEKRFNLKNIMVWYKPGGGMGDLECGYTPNYELILFGHKGRRPLNGKRIADVMTVVKVPGSKMVHPTEKPVPELRKLIEKSSNPGDVVFDGFMGSGAVGVAAKETGRSFVGCELSEEYFKICEKRITRASYSNIESFFN